MAANYPASLPVKTAAGANLSTNPHSALHNKMFEEIVAIDTELGTNPSGSSATVKARLELAEGTPTSHTGQIDQSTSNIGKTVTYSTYWRLGRTIIWSFKYTMTAGGSAGTAITLTVPVTASDTLGMNGAGMLTTSTQRYDCAIVGNSTTTIKLINDQSGNSFLGATPSVALASGNVIDGLVIYEAAS